MNLRRTWHPFVSGPELACETRSRESACVSSETDQNSEFSTDAHALPTTHHTQQARAVMLDGEVLVVKLVAIDAEGPCPVRVEKVSALHHKVTDDPVEDRMLVPHWVQIDAVMRGRKGKVSW